MKYVIKVQMGNEIRISKGGEKKMNPRGYVATKRATCYTKVTWKIQYWFRKYTKSVGESRSLPGQGELGARCFYLVWHKAFKDSNYGVRCISLSMISNGSLKIFWKLFYHLKSQTLKRVIKSRTSKNMKI